ncbi:MAG: hypothetical protein QXN96_02720 [Candidatus Bathyarchaeia archaeon]
MAGRKRVRPPSHKITIYIPLDLMEAFDRYLYDKKRTMTETIEELVKELLKKEGYFGETSNETRRD